MTTEQFMILMSDGVVATATEIVGAIAVVLFVAVALVMVLAFAGLALGGLD